MKEPREMIYKCEECGELKYRCSLTHPNENWDREKGEVFLEYCDCASGNTEHVVLKVGSMAPVCLEGRRNHAWSRAS